MRFAICAAAISLLCAPALAADMAPRYTKAPVAAAEVYNWTGFYVGANGGYAWRGGKNDPFVANDPLIAGVTCGGILGGTCPGVPSNDLSGGFGGVQAGYNWQFNQRWLLGVEADVQGGDIRGSGRTGNFQLGLSVAQLEVQQKIDYFGTVRGRIGFLPTDRLLIYATGGFAWANVTDTGRVDALTEQGANGFGFAFGCQAITNSAPPCFTGSQSRIATGWTAGAGFEYAFWNKWSLKAEYLFTSLDSGGAVKVTALDNSAFNNPALIKASFLANFGRPDFNLVRVGLNYKFGGPVVARY
jgi:outer membrane immunogenic protein